MNHVMRDDAHNHNLSAKDMALSPSPSPSPSRQDAADPVREDRTGSRDRDGNGDRDGTAPIRSLAFYRQHEMPDAIALGLTYDFGAMLGAATRAGDRTLAGLHVDAVVLSGRYGVVSAAAMMGVSEPGLRGFLDGAGGAIATA